MVHRQNFVGIESPTAYMPCMKENVFRGDGLFKVSTLLAGYLVIVVRMTVIPPLLSD